MSTHSRPFAKGYGILLGLIILWGASLALFLLGKMLLSGDGDAGV